jgi:hypothetical protein
MVVKVWSRFLATRQIKGKPRWWKDVVGAVVGCPVDPRAGWDQRRVDLAATTSRLKSR